MTGTHSDDQVNLRSIADHLPALIAYVDRQRVIRYANATYAAWHGLPLSRILNRSVSDILGPERYAVVAPHLERALKGENVTWETTFQHRDNGERKLHVRYTPDTRDGETQGIYALIEDVTELIRRAEQHYLMQSAIASSLNAIALACLEGRLTYVNDAFLNMWQLSRHDEAVGRHATDFWDDPQDAHAVIESLAQKGQWQGELQALRSDGSTFRARLSAHLVKNDKGEPISMMASFTDVTPEIASEQAVRRIAASLNEAQRLAKVGSWELDLPANKLTWSDEIFRIFEIDQSRFGASYDAFLETIHPDDRETVHAAYTNSLRTRAPYTVEHRLLMPDGRVKWVREQCKTFYADDGTPLRSLGTVQDITERYAAQLELRKTTRLLNSIVQHLPNMVFVKNAKDLSFALFNRAGEELLGLAADQLINKTDYDFFPREQADFFTAKDRAVLEKGDVLDIPEEIIDTAAHGRRLLHTKKIALLDEHGQPQYLLGISEDITERKRAEDALRQLNETLEQRVAERTSELEAERSFIDTVLDTVGALVVVLDRRGSVVRFNPACEDLTGFTADELQDRPLWEHVVPPERRAGVQQVFANLRDTAMPSNYDNEWLTRAGERRLITWSNSTIKDEQGAAKYIVATGIDITERKIAENALISAKEDAERANAVKSAFLSRMSHELRTPLNAILGFAQLLDSAEPPLPDRDKESVKEILQAGKHLLELINEVLDLTRIETGKVSLKLEPLDFCAVAADSAALVAPLAASRSIRIELPPPHAPDWVLADAIRLKQVLLNLLSNAAKYNLEGGLIQITCEPDGDEWIRMTISDTGRGVAAQDLHRLFEPFERLDADKQLIEGSGIGLAISKGLVTLMNGDIGVESTLGIGSRFWVRLPRTTGPE